MSAYKFLFLHLRTYGLNDFELRIRMMACVNRNDLKQISSILLIGVINML